MRVRLDTIWNVVNSFRLGAMAHLWGGRSTISLMGVVFVVVVAAACGGGNTDYVPKPKAYPKMSLPAKSYGFA